MRERHIDNFKQWRDRMKGLGVIPKSYPAFTKTVSLAEFIGVVLGDGNIGAFPRTQRLLIVGNSNNPGFINRYANLVENLFGKKATVSRVHGSRATRIGLYQKYISERLDIPCGDKRNLEYKLPYWISSHRANLIGWLRGLYEAEGSLSIHKPTYTYNFQFSNKNKGLLDLVQESLETLAFHPERRINSVRLRKKEEVANFKELIRFRQYK